MSWNYRVVRHSEDDDVWYAIHEAYYDEDGRLNGLTVEPVPLTAATLAELRLRLDQALGKPVVVTTSRPSLDPGTPRPDKGLRRTQSQVGL